MDREAVPEFPRIISVTAVRRSFVLAVTWSDGRKSRVDMTGLVHRSPHFRVFIEDMAAFARVAPDEYGTGVEWENGLDYSARTLLMLADDQSSVAGRYLKQFEARHGLTIDETAQILDVTTRTIKNWRDAAVLPRMVYIALRRFETDPTALAAVYRPVKIRPRGRPKTVVRQET